MFTKTNKNFKSLRCEIPQAQTMTSSISQLLQSAKIQASRSTNMSLGMEFLLLLSD